MTEQQIKYMVDRFLGWKLPENFRPDDGISFEPIAGKDGPHPFRRTPSGTNLFGFDQADAMVRYMVEGMGAEMTNNQDSWMSRALKLESALRAFVNIEDGGLRSSEFRGAFDKALSDAREFLS